MGRCCGALALLPSLRVQSLDDITLTRNFFDEQRIPFGDWHSFRAGIARKK
jgi:hypothetical protein